VTEKEVLELIWGATITPEEWVRRIRANPSYAWKNTKYGKALLAARALGQNPGPNPPSPPPSSGLAAQIQSVIYCAQNPLSALVGPAHMKPALTADPGYASFTTPAVVSQLKAHFGTCGAWFVQTQVPVQHAKDFVAQYGLDFLIFQGETSEEYRTATEANAKLMIGNANSWTAEQRADATARINAGTLAFCQEAYTNLGNPWPDQTGTQGVPAASLCIAVYDGSGKSANGWYPTVSDYRQHTPASAWAGISVYHAAGMRASDWAAL
jgi:hypothetical protein